MCRSMLLVSELWLKSAFLLFSSFFTLRNFEFREVFTPPPMTAAFFIIVLTSLLALEKKSKLPLKLLLDLLVWWVATLLAPFYSPDLFNMAVIDSQYLI